MLDSYLGWLFRQNKLAGYDGKLVLMAMLAGYAVYAGWL
jgi:hypothetical protein